jgi:5-methylcytosine-specific restriction endonuclease McrBC regulatory subunit McrC
MQKCFALTQPEQTKTRRHSLNFNTEFITAGSKEFVKVDEAQELAFFEANREDLSKIFDVDIQAGAVCLYAKASAFGAAKILNRSIVVYPKFFRVDDPKSFDLMTSLFFLASKSAPAWLKAAVKQERSAGFLDKNFVEFYFYLYLKQTLSFLKRYNRVSIVTYEEEVNGLRGRLKPLDSIRRFQGMKHKTICEIQQIEPRAFFLGLILGFTQEISRFCVSDNCKDVAGRIQYQLAGIDPLPLSSENMKRLGRMKSLLISEHRQSKHLIEQMVGFFELLKRDIGFISHSAFSFDMNRAFESIVLSLLERKFGKWADVIDGNETSEQLLNGELFSVELDSEGEFDSRSIEVRPDIFLFGKSNSQIVWVLDAKYKMLEIGGDKLVRGIQSKDIQQMLIYWLNKTHQGFKEVRLSLVYPLETPSGSDRAIRKLGRVEFSKPKGLGSGKVVITVLGLNVIKACSSFVSEELNNEAVA